MFETFLVRLHQIQMLPTFHSLLLHIYVLCDFGNNFHTTKHEEETVSFQLWLFFLDNLYFNNLCLNFVSKQ